MDNKKNLSISVLLISVAIFYYLVFNLPGKSKENEKQLSLENARICQEAAMALHRQDGKDTMPGQSQMEPRYKYVESENLCVYRGGFITPEVTHEYLKDVMTNETIASHITNIKGVDKYGDKKEFDKAVTKYFLGVTY